MKKWKYIFVLLLFTVFVPKVYAFTYDLEATVDSTSVKEGSVKEIKVSFKEVEGVLDGFGACSMNIELDSNISLNGNVKGLNGWTVMPGEVYSFDTSEAFVSNSEMFTIPVKVNNAGSVRLTNIMCSDGNTKESISDKTINFTISQNDDNNEEVPNDDVDQPDVEIDPNSTNLANITLSEGTIEFDPEITEYNITVSDFENLQVSVETESDTSSYIIDKNDVEGNKSISIMVVALDETSKIYTIYVTEDDTANEDDGSQKNNYVPIFIGIICVLVFINIFRIVRNKKK